MEKHITHDWSLKGIDHEAALNPDEFAKFASMVRELESAKGVSTPKPFTQEEIKYRRYSEKSVLAGRDLPIGTVIRKDDLLYMRADDVGLPPDQAYRLIGQVTKRGVASYHLVLEDDIA